MAQDFTLDVKKFSGLHYSSDNTEELEAGESPEMVNFKITSGYKLQKREGYSSVSSFADEVRGIFYGVIGGADRYLAVAGEVFYVSESGFGELSPLEKKVPGEGKVTFFPFHGDVYLLTGAGILKYDGETLSDLEPHIPLVMISTSPDGSGVMYEEVNLLTRKIRQRFSPDGVSYRFYPIIPDVAKIDWMRLNGEDVRESSYTWDDNIYAFVFVGAPKAGIDTLEVQYEIDREDASDRILHCRYATAFGGASDTRAFLYGNPDSPATRYHSGVVEGKPSFAYFPETAFALVGTGDAITSILRHYDRQLIFTASSAYYSYLEYMNGAEGKLVAAFPVLPLNEERGCVAPGQALLVENTPVTLAENGLFQWVSTNIRDERNATRISDPIDRALQKEELLKAVLFNRKETSELYLCIGGKCFVYSYRLKLFYYYELPEIRGFCRGAEELFFHTDSGIFSVGGEKDAGEVIPSFWKSKLLDFSAKNKRKKLFGVTLFGKAARGGEVAVSLRGENETEKNTKRVLFSGKADGERIGLRMHQRRFRLLEVEITSESLAPIHVMGISLKGRITDGDES